MAGALLGEEVGDLERLPDLLPVVARLPLEIALLPLAVEPVVVLEECCAGAETVMMNPPRLRACSMA